MQMQENEKPDWSLFNNEENQSFLSSHHSTTSQALTDSINKKENSHSRIYYFPLMYLVISLTVLLLAILNQLKYARAQTFPLFLDLPFQTNQAFTIGNAAISFLGIITYYFIFTINQKRIIQKGCFTVILLIILSIQNQIGMHTYNPFIFFCGVLGHFFFFAFALLPQDKKQNLEQQFLYTEDRLFLTLSFLFNFIFTIYYIYFNAQLRNGFHTVSMQYQIKTALFTVMCFLFAACIQQIYLINMLVASVNLISLCLGMPVFQEKEPNLEDNLSAAEDFIASMVSEIYSTLAYSLFIINALFIGMYYYDLKMVNFMMTIKEQSMVRKYHSNL